MVEWTRQVGKTLWMVITISRYNSGQDCIKFSCERSGKYTKEEKEKVRKGTGTKKCGCPFALKYEKLDTNDYRTLGVICGTHNQGLTTYLAGNSYVGRLSAEDKPLLVDMYQHSAAPREILNTLKERDCKNASTMRTIYNACYEHPTARKSRST